MVDQQQELTIKEVIEHYHDLSASVLARYLREGRITGRQLGGTWLIERNSLEAYLRSPRRPGVKPGTKRKTKETEMEREGHSSPGF